MRRTNPTKQRGTRRKGMRIKGKDMHKEAKRVIGVHNDVITILPSIIRSITIPSL